MSTVAQWALAISEKGRADTASAALRLRRSATEDPALRVESASLGAFGESNRQPLGSGHTSEERSGRYATPSAAALRCYCDGPLDKMPRAEWRR